MLVVEMEAGVCQITLAGSRIGSLIGREILDEEKVCRICTSL